MRVEQSPDVLAGANLEPQVNAGMAGQEGGQRGGQDVLARGGHRRDAYPAPLGIQAAARGGQRLLDAAREWSAHTLGEGPPGRGQPSAAFPLDQGHPDLAGQGGEWPRTRRTR